MIINFPQQPKWFTFERLVMWLIIIVLAVGILKFCGQQSTWQQKLADKEAQRKKEVDSIQARFEKYQQYAFGEINKWTDSAEVLLAEVTVLRYERDQAWVGLEKNKVAADRLIANIRNSKGKDSADCLELTEKYTEAAGQVVAYKNKSDQLVARLDTAGKYKDNIIKAQKELVDTAIAVNKRTKAQYDSLYRSFKKVLPSTVLSGGFTAMGSKTNPLSGAGIAGLLTFPNGNSLGVRALMMRDENLYIGVDWLWKFSLRKKR